MPPRTRGRSVPAILPDLTRVRAARLGTPESWRTCGYDNPSGAFSKASLRLRLARGAGPRVRRGPGVPRALPVFRRARWQNSGANRAARMRTVALLSFPRPAQRGEGG